jgi:hypothetical protein
VNPDDYDYGIELPHVYDGVSVWVMKDGTRVNRWADVPGYERRAAEVDEWLASGSVAS